MSFLRSLSFEDASRIQNQIIASQAREKSPEERDALQKAADRYLQAAENPLKVNCDTTEFGKGEMPAIVLKHPNPDNKPVRWFVYVGGSISPLESMSVPAVHQHGAINSDGSLNNIILLPNVLNKAAKFEGKYIRNEQGQEVKLNHSWFEKFYQYEKQNGPFSPDGVINERVINQLAAQYNINEMHMVGLSTGAGVQMASAAEIVKKPSRATQALKSLFLVAPGGCYTTEDIQKRYWWKVIEAGIGFLKEALPVMFDAREFLMQMEAVSSQADRAAEMKKALGRCVSSALDHYNDTITTVPTVVWVGEQDNIFPYRVLKPQLDKSTEERQQRGDIFVVRTSNRPHGHILQLGMTFAEKITSLAQKVSRDEQLPLLQEVEMPEPMKLSARRRLLELFNPKKYIPQHTAEELAEAQNR